MKKFWREFEKFIYKYVSTTQEIIITGDLNFHLDKCNDPDALRLANLLDEYDLSQKIQEPTHTAGHTLDVLVMRNDTSILKSLSVSDPGLCNDDGKVINDHFLLCWTTSVKKLTPEPKTIQSTKQN